MNTKRTSLGIPAPSLLNWTIVLFIAAGSPVSAQTSVTGANNDPCKVESEAEADTHDQTNDLALTERLDRCGGVLEPPKVGDDMVEQPPEKGRTPVIQPGELPRNNTVPEQ